jgi:hypothetical protein
MGLHGKKSSIHISVSWFQKGLKGDQCPAETTYEACDKR